MLRQVRLRGQSESTLYNYTRCLAKLALYFKQVPTELSDEQINDFLLLIRDQESPSESYFKHTVYGLRYAFRLIGRDDRAIRLPSIKRLKQLPTVLSRAECKLLFSTPKLLRHRILLCLIYSAGLRISEAARLELKDLDLDRKMIHIRRSKYGKDRYVPLSELLIPGLQKYFAAEKPHRWVFNGKEKRCQLSTRGIQWCLRQAVKQAGLSKKVTVHTLRHSFATHLLEDGLDIHTLMQLLGHEHVHTTMVYLHVAKIRRGDAHSPFDTLYRHKSR